MTEAKKRPERTITRTVEAQFHFQIITCVGCGREAPQPVEVPPGAVGRGDLWPDLTGWQLVRLATDPHHSGLYVCASCFPPELARRIAASITEQA